MGDDTDRYIYLFKVYTTVYECACWTKCKTYNLPYQYMQPLTTVVKVVGRVFDQKDDKVRSKLGCSLKQLTTELSHAYGPSPVSYDTFRRWKNKFEFDVESIKMHQNQIG